MAQDELQQLKAAVDGLEYPSESDTPFDVVHWSAAAGINTAQDMLKARPGKKRKIAEVPVEQFFDDLAGSDDADRFKQLRKVLDAIAPGFKAYRVGDGETKVDIYLIGKTKSGDWAGLHTVSIET